MSKWIKPLEGVFEWLSVYLGVGKRRYDVHPILPENQVSQPTKEPLADEAVLVLVEGTKPAKRQLNLTSQRYKIANMTASSKVLTT